MPYWQPIRPRAALPDFYVPEIGLHGQTCTCWDEIFPLTRGKVCPQFQDIALDAGVLRLEMPEGKTIDLSPLSGTIQQYQTTLPENTIGSGTFTVTGAGGSDGGAFQFTLTLPPYPPISITTDLSPGRIFPENRSFTVSWTGGQSGQI